MIGHAQRRAQHDRRIELAPVGRIGAGRVDIVEDLAHDMNRDGRTQSGRIVRREDLRDDKVVADRGPGMVGGQGVAHHRPITKVPRRAVRPPPIVPGVERRRKTGNHVRVVSADNGTGSGGGLEFISANVNIAADNARIAILVAASCY